MTTAQDIINKLFDAWNANPQSSPRGSQGSKSGILAFDGRG